MKARKTAPKYKKGKKNDNKEERKQEKLHLKHERRRITAPKYKKQRKQHLGKKKPWKTALEYNESRESSITDTVHTYSKYMQDTLLKTFTRFLDLIDQFFLGLGLSKLFPTRESLVNDILAGDGNITNNFFTV